MPSGIRKVFKLYILYNKTLAPWHETNDTLTMWSRLLSAIARFFPLLFFIQMFNDFDDDCSYKRIYMTTKIILGICSDFMSLFNFEK